MNNLAKAIIGAVAFLEFSDDDIVDPDAAVQAMEDIAAALQKASPEELAALRAELDRELQAQVERGASEGVQNFYKQFLDNLCIPD